MNRPVVYREVQRFRNLTLWLLVGGVSLLTWYVALRQLILGQPVGDRPASDEMVIGAWVVFGVALPACFWLVALVTEVGHAGVTIRFWPFPGRRFRWQEIERTEVITYRPLRDFGGWGLRWALGRRRAYTVSGHRRAQHAPRRSSLTAGATGGRSFTVWTTPMHTCSRTTIE